MSMSPDHPHAKTLRHHYEAMASVMHGKLRDERDAGFEAVAKGVQDLLAPDFVIHTNGIRLAATGDRAFTMAMGTRRNALAGGTFRPVADLSIVADDTYAIVRGVFAAEQGDLRYHAEGAGAWRFDEQGRATEHWELGDGRVWDEFFIGCDPDFQFASGEEFWLKETRGPTPDETRCHAGTVHHVSFRVDDLAASLEFYEGVLGCTRIHRPAAAMGNGAWLQAGTTQVHLMEFPADAATGTPATEVVPWANHVAFHTDDIAAAEAGFRERGFDVRSSRSGLPQFFLSDPTGNVIEFTAF